MKSKSKKSRTYEFGLQKQIDDEVNPRLQDYKMRLTTDKWSIGRKIFP